MNSDRKKELEANGWRVGTAKEFLELTDEEAAFIELKLSLSGSLRKIRLHKNMKQSELAKLIGSSQSRVAKMEVGDPSVSVDLLVRSLLALGVSRSLIAKAIAGTG
jgi:predicted XRE-type DNA-binding protein